MNGCGTIFLGGKDVSYIRAQGGGEQVTRKVYLTIYDRYDEVLEYDTTTGCSKVMKGSDFERLGVARTFGRFAREDEHVLGVFASPQGPVLFLDAQRVLGRFGEISASVALSAQAPLRLPGASRRRHEPL
jgi:hypothetical protein